MKNYIVIFSLLAGSPLAAQYYYSDIVGSRETSELHKSYQAAGVRTVQATGVDGNGVRASDFSEFQQYTANGTTLKKTVINQQTRVVNYYRFDANNRVVEIIDSSADVQARAEYSYDAAGRISQIRRSQLDTASEFNQVELHQWTYKPDGQPASMLRTINDADSLEIKFTYDENGNPGEEIHYRRNIEVDHIYYYFDEEHRLTDLVRYDKKIKKLIPENIFSYDDAGRVIQKLNRAPADNYGKVLWVGYFIWRYIYDSRGLKVKEALFDNDRNLMGKIEYSYTTNK